MDQRIDTELVALARSGDKSAFGQLIERYQPMARRIAIGMVGNENIARELVQEALLQAYLSLNRLRDDERFKSWLYGIVLNVCRSHIRNQKMEISFKEQLAKLRPADTPERAEQMHKDLVMFVLGGEA